MNIKALCGDNKRIFVYMIVLSVFNGRSRRSLTSVLLAADKVVGIATQHFECTSNIQCTFPLLKDPLYDRVFS